MSNQAPTPGRNLLARTRLWERLDEGANGRVVFVYGPAGYGKTSLLAQWVQQDKSARSTRWMRLEDGDREDKAFLIKFAVTLGSTNASPQLVSECENLTVEELRRLVTERLRRAASNLLIVLDDFHLVENASISNYLADILLDDCFDRHRLIIASRTRPAIPVGKLWIDGGLTHLDAGDLLMSEGEVAAIFAKQSCRLQASDVRRIYQKTEGWALAVRMASLIVVRGDEGADPLAEFTGKQADVAQYLAAHLVTDLSEPDLEFLMLLSPLNRFNVALAEEVTGTNDADRRFSKLEQLGVPLSALDGDRNWLRLHSVFQDFLRQKPFPRENSARNILIKAAKWFETNRDIEGAVSHALGANDYTLGAEIVEKAGGWRLLYAGAGGIRRYLPDIVANLPQADYPMFPRTSLGNAVLFAKDGDLLSARQEFNRVKTLPISIDALLEREICVIGHLLALYNDIPASRTENVELESGLGISAHDPILHALTLNIMCFHCLEFSDLCKALEYGALAINEFHRAKAFFGEAHLNTHIGQAHFMMGNIRAARNAYAELRSSAQNLLGHRSDLEAMAQVLDAEVLVERGEFSAAEAELSWSLPQLENGDCWFDILTAAYLAAFRLKTARGQYADAFKVLDRASQTAANRRYDRLARLVERERIYLLASVGMASDARTLAALHGLDEAMGLHASVNDLSHRLRGPVPALIWARIYHGEGDHNRALNCLDRLDAMQMAALSPMRSLRLNIFRLRLLLAAHKEGAANALLDRLLLLPSLNGICASFMAEGSEVLDFMRHRAAAPGLSPIMKTNLTNVLDLLKAVDLDTGSKGVALTDRELSVLRLVDRGLSNKEIARTLNLSGNTIKFHLKNAFQKLDCTSRTAALSSARQFGLLDN